MKVWVGFLLEVVSLRVSFIVSQDGFLSYLYFMSYGKARRQLSVISGMAINGIRCSMFSSNTSLWFVDY